MAVAAEDGSGARAASLFSRLLQGYPGTPQATQARNRMKELVRANPNIETEGVDVGAPAAVDEPDETSLMATNGDLARLTGVRHYSDHTHTRVVLDLDRSVRFQSGEVQNPQRLFIDLLGVDRPASLAGAEAE